MIYMTIYYFFQMPVHNLRISSGGCAVCLVVFDIFLHFDESVLI